MPNRHRSPPMNQSETDLGIVNESQLLGFGMSPRRRGHRIILSIVVVRVSAVGTKASSDFRSSGQSRPRVEGPPLPVLTLAA